MDDRAAYLRRLLDAIDVNTTSIASILSLLSILSRTLTSSSFEPDASIWQSLGASGEPDWTWETIVEEDPLVGEHWESIHDVEAETLYDTSSEDDDAFDEDYATLGNEKERYHVASRSGLNDATSSVAPWITMLDADAMLQSAAAAEEFALFKRAQYWQRHRPFPARKSTLLCLSTSS